MEQNAKVTILSHVNLEPVAKFSRNDAFELIWDGFNTLLSQLISEKPRFKDNHSDIVWIHIDPNYPGLLERLPWEWSDDSSITSDWAQIIASIENAVRSFPGTAFLISNVYISPYTPAPLISGRKRHRIEYALNEPLHKICSDNPNTAMLDVAGLFARVGASQWSDSRLWYIGGIPYSRPALEELRKLLLSHLEAFTRRPSKVLALDLDNTLWGGIVDAVDTSPVELGPSGIGLAYRTFQDILLSLSRMGVLLTVISKNDEDSALDLINNHSQMRIRAKHLAGIKINWHPKSQSLKTLSEDLGIPLSAFVVLDDDPRERAEIAMNCPEVPTPELPEDPVDRPDWLLRTFIPTYFAIPRVSEEDAARTASYQRIRMRSAQQVQAPDESAFLKSLQIRIEVLPPDNKDWARLSQLSFRTNQFNLNGKHWDPPAMMALQDSAEWSFLSLRYSDRFGDEGIVGMAAFSFDDISGSIFIHAFCVSCRVLEKRVEHAFLHRILLMNKDLLPQRVCFHYADTGRNGRLRAFLSSVDIPMDGPIPFGAFQTLISRLERMLP